MLIGIEAFFFLYWREREWSRVILHRAAIRFPSFCPFCMAETTDGVVIEASYSRNKNIFRKEFLTLKVPYCNDCSKTITSIRNLAFRLSALLALLICFVCWLWNTTHEARGDWFGTACLLGLVLIWPLYSVMSHHKRGLSLRRYNQTQIDVRIRNVVYAECLHQLNLGTH